MITHAFTSAHPLYAELYTILEMADLLPDELPDVGIEVAATITLTDTNALVVVDDGTDGNDLMLHPDPPPIKTFFERFADGAQSMRDVLPPVCKDASCNLIQLSGAIEHWTVAHAWSCPHRDDEVAK